MHKLRILARAELALAQIKVKRTGFQVVLFALAGLFVFSCLILLNLAGYQALVPKIGAAFAALSVAGTNLLMAAIAVAIALNAKPGRADEELAQKIRDQATEEITKDVDEIREEIQRVSDEIAGIRAGVASMRDAVPNVKAVVDLASSVKKKLDDSG
jgi:hypothetical protein